MTLYQDQPIRLRRGGARRPEIFYAWNRGILGKFDRDQDAPDAGERIEPGGHSQPGWFREWVRALFQLLGRTGKFFPGKPLVGRDQARNIQTENHLRIGGNQ